MTEIQQHDRLAASVIIPAHNAAGTLEQCILACLDQTQAPVEVIVVDDGSRDRTADIAVRLPVKYVHQEQCGPAAARNHGARMAAGAILVFTDSDCVPTRTWIEKLLAGFDAEDIVAAGGSYGIANPESRLARIIHAEIRARHDNMADSVDFLGSFNVAYRKAAFEAAGGFDENFTQASGEDNDLAYRLTQLGRMRFVKDAIVDHYHPARLGSYLRSQARHGFWRMKLYAIHPGRARGDLYASLLDLSAPPLSLLVLILLPVFLAVPVARTVVAMVWSAYFLMLGIRAVKLMSDVDVRISPQGSAGLLALRDLARAWGMLKGLWVFLILRRTAR
ncbi:MAG: glycosyltransferase [Candidatus Hydrogenedentes bacterium]|nr:glycosyltransferase [Candidatus Hydrogenedentota bacterium]